MRPEKTAMLKEVQGHLESSGFAILVDYRGLTVEEFTALRGQLREQGSRVQVVRNAFFRRAATDLGRPVEANALEGPTAMIWGDGDVTQVAKTLKTFAKQFQRPVVKGGLLGARALSSADVEEMAGMPSREVMLGRFVGTVAAPMTQLVGVMNQKLLSLLYALQAAAEKRGQANG